MDKFPCNESDEEWMEFLDNEVMASMETPEVGSTSNSHETPAMESSMQFMNVTDRPQIESSAADNNGSSLSVERKKRRTWTPWTNEEHSLFLYGLRTYGKGNWKNIAKNCVKTKTHIQVASHAQKYFLQQGDTHKEKERKRSNIPNVMFQNNKDNISHDINQQSNGIVPYLSNEQLQQRQEILPSNTLYDQQIQDFLNVPPTQLPQAQSYQQIQDCLNVPPTQQLPQEQSNQEIQAYSNFLLTQQLQLPQYNEEVEVYPNTLPIQQFQQTQYNQEIQVYPNFQPTQQSQQAQHNQVVEVYPTTLPTKQLQQKREILNSLCDFAIEFVTCSEEYNDIHLEVHGIPTLSNTTIDLGEIDMVRFKRVAYNRYGVSMIFYRDPCKKQGVQIGNSRRIATRKYTVFWSNGYSIIALNI